MLNNYNVKSQIRLDLVKIHDIPNIVGNINSITDKKALDWSSSSKYDGSVFIDDSQVLAVTDSIGNITYSFQLYSDDFDSLDMYNLIAAKRISGQEVRPYIIKYSFATLEKRIEYKLSKNRRFNGKMTVYSLENFINTYDIASRGGSPSPCPDFKDVDINSDNSSQGNGGTGTSGSGSASSGGNGTGSSMGTSSGTIWGWVDMPPGSSYCSCSVEVGEGNFGTYGTDGALQKNISAANSKGESDCPKIDIIIPINDIIEFEDKIDDTLLKPCLKNILNELKNIEQGVGHIVNKFAGNNPGFNWKVQDGSLIDQTGQTSQQYNRSTGTANTTFDSGAWPDATDLSWARTILHESVHAYIVASFGADYSGSQKTFSDFFKDFLNRNYSNNNDAHHAEIARNFIQDVSKALQTYGTINGYNLPNQFYEDMAWGGLTDWPKRDSRGNIVTDSHGRPVFEETPWFKSSYPSNSDKQRIKNTILIELMGIDMNGNNKPQKGNNAGC